MYVFQSWWHQSTSACSFKDSNLLLVDTFLSLVFTPQHRKDNQRNPCRDMPRNSLWRDCDFIQELQLLNDVTFPLNWSWAIVLHSNEEENSAIIVNSTERQILSHYSLCNSFCHWFQWPKFRYFRTIRINSYGFNFAITKPRIIFDNWELVQCKRICLQI